MVVITDELIASAKAAGACFDGLARANNRIGASLCELTFGDCLWLESRGLADKNAWSIGRYGYGYGYGDGYGDGDGYGYGYGYGNGDGDGALMWLNSRRIEPWQEQACTG